MSEPSKRRRLWPSPRTEVKVATDRPSPYGTTRSSSPPLPQIQSSAARTVEIPSACEARTDRGEQLPSGSPTWSPSDQLLAEAAAPTPAAAVEEPPIPPARSPSLTPAPRLLPFTGPGSESDPAPGVAVKWSSPSGGAITTSPLTSIPSSAQTGTSKRTVHHGNDFIKDSASEETEDSDTDLEDLSAILGRFRKEKENVAGGANVDHDQLPSVHGRSNITKARASESARIDRTFKFSLASLVEASEREQEEQKKLAQLKAEAESDGEGSNLASDSDAVVRKSLKAAIEPNAADSDEAQAETDRVLEAMKKTSAFEEDTVCHIFSGFPLSPAQTQFPANAIPGHSWMRMLSNPAKRHSAFLSGFVKSAAYHQPLPAELVSWLIVESCLERRSDLAAAYREVWATSLARFKVNVTVVDVERVFRQISLAESAFDAAAVVMPTKQLPGLPASELPSNVLRVIELCEQMAPHMTTDARLWAMKCLLLLSLDFSIRARNSCVLGIRNALLAVIESIPEGETEALLSQLAQIIFNSVQSPVLRQQLIAHFPAASTRAYLLRRRLALSFVLNSAKYLNADITNRSHTARIVLHLQNELLYRHTAKKDISTLAAYIALLGVAIGNGFSDFSFLIEASGPDGVGKEREFNIGIDMLAKEVKEIAARIRVTGAMNMRGAEAKASAERLVQKLYCAVRTKPRDTKHWFHRGDDEGRDFMTLWVTAGQSSGGSETPASEPQNHPAKLPAQSPATRRWHREAEVAGGFIARRSAAARKSRSELSGAQGPDAGR